ncbi:hypothetical protein [Tabrizicola sp. YIM 78059]|uniref:hypothetical protein n=1 Tax=Tabrizicola sp. YIM 78059 TaxID=2529861 RepID=UPI0010AA0A10|nr:hypothetical protein [Tabrizicola sp. YIM 78059]
MDKQGATGSSQRVKKIRVIGHRFNGRASLMASRHEAAVTETRICLAGLALSSRSDLDFGQQGLCHAKPSPRRMPHQHARE